MSEDEVSKVDIIELDGKLSRIVDGMEELGHVSPECRKTLAKLKKQSTTQTKDCTRGCEILSSGKKRLRKLLGRL